MCVKKTALILRNILIINQIRYKKQLLAISRKLLTEQVNIPHSKAPVLECCFASLFGLGKAGTLHLRWIPKRKFGNENAYAEVALGLAQFGLVGQSLINGI